MWIVLKNRAAPAPTISAGLAQWPGCEAGPAIAGALHGDGQVAGGSPTDVVERECDGIAHRAVDREFPRRGVDDRNVVVNEQVAGRAG
jgi:hypothetical protein